MSIISHALRACHPQPSATAHCLRQTARKPFGASDPWQIDGGTRRALPIATGTLRVEPASSNRGAGAGQANATGVASVNTTSSSTTAVTSEEVLISYTLPASSLSANGKGVRIRAWGKTAINGNSKTLRLYFGTTVVMTNDVSTSPNNLDWQLDAVVIRDGVNSEVSIGSGTFGAAQQSITSSAPTAGNGAGITIKITGQNGVPSAGDITALGLIVEYIN